MLLAAGQNNSGVLAQSGTFAFLIVFGMGVILFFVFRSMAKHLRKINDAASAEAAAQAEAESQADGHNISAADTRSDADAGQSSSQSTVNSPWDADSR